MKDSGVRAKCHDFLHRARKSADTCEVRANYSHRGELFATALGLSVTVVFLLWLALHLGGDSGVRYFDDIVTSLTALFACVACFLAAKRQGGADRHFWLLLGLALGAWTCAEVIWAVYDLALKVAVPVPSWADVGYLGAIPLAAAALLSHPGIHTKGNNRARVTLDGMAIGTALLLLSWTFVLGPLWRHTEVSTAGGVVALAYPFGDVIIIFLIILSVRSISAEGRRPLMWVLLGLLAMALANSTYAYLVEVGRYSTGNLVDAGWVLGYLAIGAGAFSDAGAATVVLKDEPAETSLVSLVTPYIPVLLALCVITVKLEIHSKVDRLSWLAGFGLALLVIARQLLQLIDHHEELFGPQPEPEGPEEQSLDPRPPATDLLEAGSWPQFLRRLP